MLMKDVKISLLLLTYNQENFIEEAVRGILSQDYSPLQIVISDDYSSDRTFSIIEAIMKDYDGPNIVVLNRNDTNLGFVPHINEAFSKLVNGDIIILAAGDDISLPNRVSVTMEYFKRYENAYAISFPLEIIDKNSVVIEKQKNKKKSLYTLDTKYILSPNFMVGGGALAVRREVINEFGVLNSNCPTEDSTFRLRALLLGSVIKGTSVCVRYRRHINGISSSQNLYKLKTELIAEQYKTDIEIAFKKKLINDKKRKILLRKVNIYKKTRTYDEQISISSSIHYQLFLKFKKHIVIVLYRIQILSKCLSII